MWFLPLYLFTMPILLVWSIPHSFQNPYGLVRLIPLVVAIVGVAWFVRRKNGRLANGIAAWAFLTYLADALAWWLTKWQIPPERSTMRWASDFPSMFVAGFPVHLLQVPPSPMGSDVPPSGEWWVIFANLACWAVVAAITVLATLRGRITLPWLEKAVLRWKPVWLLVGAAVLNQGVVATMMIWFD